MRYVTILNPDGSIHATHTNDGLDYEKLYGGKTVLYTDYPIRQFENTDDDVPCVPAFYEPTDDELWASIRHVRNKRLDESDWSQLIDASLTTEQKTSYTIYRQELRDLPQVQELGSIVFPVIDIEK